MVKDIREGYYLTKMREYGNQFREYHPPSSELLLNLVFTYDRLHSHMEARISAYGLSISAFNILTILKGNPAKQYSQQELSKLLLVSRANTTGLVESLVKKNLIRQVNSPKDRRVRIIRLTEKGDRLLEMILPEHFMEMKRLGSALSAEEKHTMVRFLKRLRDQVVDGKDKR